MRVSTNDATSQVPTTGSDSLSVATALATQLEAVLSAWSREAANAGGIKLRLARASVLGVLDQLGDLGADRAVR